MKVINVEYDDFILAYNKNLWKPASIANDLGVNRSVVMRHLKKFNLESYSDRTSKDRFTIAFNHTDGTVIEIAKYMMISESVVYSLSHKYSISLNSVTNKRRSAEYVISGENILTCYDECEGVPNRIANYLGVCVATVQKHMNRLEIEPKKPKNILDKGEVENLYNKYNGNATKMANNSTISTMTMLTYMKEYDLVVNYSNNVSGAETELFDFISSIINCRVEQSVKGLISPFEVDLYIPDMNIAIEYNGLRWHSEQFNKTASYHLKKTNMCADVGVRLIHIFEDEWLDKPDLVKCKLSNIFGIQGNKVYARKCNIVDVSNKNRKVFLESTHIYGDGSGSINIGLNHDDELVAFMNFIQIGKNKFKLNRYSTIKSVVGGFSKLLAHFIKTYHPEYIETFADLRFSDKKNTVYSKCGFDLDSITKPGYFYTKGSKRLSRQQFMKHKLKLKFKDGYDDALSEVKNCNNNGWYRIWDVGHLKYTWSTDETRYNK